MTVLSALSICLLKEAGKGEFEMTRLKCSVKNCMYNEDKLCAKSDINQDCKCHADEIGIAGSNACCCSETECASFDCQCK